jgi:hypothetical protein
MKEHETHHIAVAPDSETAQVIKQAAAGVTIVVDTGDGLYEVQARPTVPVITEETAVEPRSETPMAFYARVRTRPDIRAILQRLAQV